MDELLAPASSDIKNTIKAGIEPRLAMDKPPKREWKEDGLANDEILAKFQNPFELQELFTRKKHDLCRIPLV